MSPPPQPPLPPPVGFSRPLTVHRPIRERLPCGRTAPNTSTYLQTALSTCAQTCLPAPNDLITELTNNPPQEVVLIVWPERGAHQPHPQSVSGLFDDQAEPPPPPVWRAPPHCWSPTQTPLRRRFATSRKGPGPRHPGGPTTLPLPTGHWRRAWPDLRRGPRAGLPLSDGARGLLLRAGHKGGRRHHDGRLPNYAPGPTLGKWGSSRPFLHPALAITPTPTPFPLFLLSLGTLPLTAFSCRPPSFTRCFPGTIQDQLTDKLNFTHLCRHFEHHVVPSCTVTPSRGLGPQRRAPAWPSTLQTTSLGRGLARKGGPAGLVPLCQTATDWRLPSVPPQLFTAGLWLSKIFIVLSQQIFPSV